MNKSGIEWCDHTWNPSATERGRAVSYQHHYPNSYRMGTECV